MQHPPSDESEEVVEEVEEVQRSSLSSRRSPWLGRGAASFTPSDCFSVRILFLTTKRFLVLSDRSLDLSLDEGFGF